MPKVSIIIPLYNKEKFVQETLKSVKDQTFSDWECIIINDGATDNSFKIIKDFIEGDNRFKTIKNNVKTQGASAARNLGLKISKGRYIQFLDADDILSKDKLEEQVKLMDADANITIATCSWGRLSNSSKYIKYEKLPSYKDFNSIEYFINSLIFSKGYFPLHSYLMRRVVIEKAGVWNERISLNDDGEFMMRIIINSKKISFAPNAIAWYRSSDGNNLSAYKNKDAVEKAIYSWMLIEANLKIRFGDKVDKFIYWSKENLFLNINGSFPILLSKHNFFFRNQIDDLRKSESFKGRILEKFKKFCKKILL